MPSLPEGVEFPLGAGDPVPSALLVKLQEALVGDHHPVRPIMLGPAAWQTQIAGRGAGGTLAQLGNSEWAWGGAVASLLVANAPVPSGHELAEIDWFYSRGGAGTITRSVYTRLLSTGAAEAQLVAPTGDAASAVWAAANDKVGYMVPAFTAITLEIQLANAAHLLGGAIVWYRKLP